jgi:hypothetical protein
MALLETAALGWWADGASTIPFSKKSRNYSFPGASLLPDFSLSQVEAVDNQAASNFTLGFPSSNPEIP